MTAIKYPDGTIDVPVAACAGQATGDAVLTLTPRDPGYEDAADGAIPAEEHPLRKPRDLSRAAELEQLFRSWDEHRQSA